MLDDDSLGWISDWVAGVEHVIEIHESDNGIRVDAINMSLVSDLFGGTCDFAEEPFSQACRDAVDLGIAIFTSAGNSGRRSQISLPACFTSLVAVGAANAAGTALSGFSDRNRFLDVVAPGEAITSAGVGGGTSTFFGSSQACSQVTASALFLRQIESSVTPESLLQIVLDTGVPIFDVASGLTFPRLDTLAAVNALRIPGVENLTCLYHSIGRSLVPFWQPVDDVDQILAVVLRNGNEVERQVLPRGSVKTVFNVMEDAFYDVRVTAIESDFAGVTSACSITVTGLSPSFVRGDCNNDGRVDIADSIRGFDWLFRGEPEPSCRNACDTNDDGIVDLTDIIYTLEILFRGTAEALAPFPACGVDLTPQGVECTFSVCENQ